MSRNNLLKLAVGVIFLILVGRLAVLQLIEGRKYQTYAKENSAKTILAPAPRGIIYDCRGEVLVENRPVFSIQVLPEVLSDKDINRKKKILGTLGQLLGEEITFRPTADQPIIIKTNVPPEIAFQVEELKDRLEGVVISPLPARYYPQENIGSHVLGYVGEIEPAELALLKSAGYKLGDYIGKDGVEKFYDRYLRGIDGGKKIEVDVRGRPTRVLESQEPVPGSAIKLTIDSGLQIAAEKALGGKSGAVVVLDPWTGAVLALVSRPNYDPNVFISPAKSSAKARLLLGTSHPFMNRALAIYPPGSIFKVVTLSAALMENVAKPEETLYCPGYYKINNRIAKCWKESGHGRISVAEGLTQSCDIVFYELGRRLGPDKLAKYARLYGLGEKTNIDIPQEKKGLVPDTNWKKTVWGENWYEGDSINYGIGQGFVQVTPVQMAAIYGAIATGKRLQPYIVKEVISHDGQIVYTGKPRQIAGLPINQRSLAVIRQALVNVVDRATGRAAKVTGLLAAGKTGTAQNPGLPHAWFLCYAPTAEPKIVIAAFVEHGQHGDQASAFVARDILTWYRDHRLAPTPSREVAGQ